MVQRATWRQLWPHSLGLYWRGGDGTAGHMEAAVGIVPRSLLDRWGWYSGPHGGSCGPTP